MALKYQVDSLDEVDSAARGFYVEAESGGFVLDAEGVAPAAKVEEFVRKLRTAEKTAKQTDAELKMYKELGLSAAEIREIQTKATTLEEQLRATSGGKREEIEAQIRKQVLGETGDKLKTLEQQLGEMRSKAEDAERKLAMKETTKEARARAAKLGVTERWLDILVDERVEAGKITRGDEGDDLYFTKGDKGAMSFDDYIAAEITARPELTGENTGAGATGSKGRTLGKRTLDGDDPVALGRNWKEVAEGRVAVK